MAQEAEKHCPKCDESWPASRVFFYADPAGTHGLYYCCKACYSEHHRSPEERRVTPPKPPMFSGLALSQIWMKAAA